TRSCPIWPLFVRLNVYVPGARLVVIWILNSDSATGMSLGAAGAWVCVVVAGAVVVVADAVVVLAVVVGAVVVGAVSVGAAFDPSAAWLSLGSRPKKKTANIIPTNRATDTVRKAGRPRLPG